MAAPRSAAARRVPPDQQSAAALAEVARILGVFGDFPQAGQADAVGMKQAPEALAIDAPAQIGSGIDGSCDRLPKEIWQTQRQSAAQDAEQSDLVVRQWRLAGTTPHFLVRVGEHGIAHLSKA